MDEIDVLICQLIGGPLPPLTPEERAAVASLPDDFAERICRGDAAKFDERGMFAGWRGSEEIRA